MQDATKIFKNFTNGPSRYFLLILTFDLFSQKISTLLTFIIVDNMSKRLFSIKVILILIM